MKQDEDRKGNEVARKQAVAVKQKNRIFIVDDHPIVRKGLAQLIDQEADLAVCGEAEDAETALELLRKAKPDLAIVDISLRGTDGIELTRLIRTRFEDIPVLVVSMHDESLFAERALKAGARGYIMKQEAIEKMMGAIRRVLRGELYVSEHVSANIVKKFVDAGDVSSPEELLSDREIEVFRLLGRGFGTRQIAEALQVSIKTVETYRVNIKKKLNLASATELLKHAIHWIESR